MHVLIVDDELHSRNVLEKMLHQHFPVFMGISQAATVAHALESISTTPPQIIFLDIQMQGESGFDLLQQLPAYAYKIIFVTAFDQYAIKAFRFNAVDYLLKPIVIRELKEAVNKAIHQLKHEDGTNQENVYHLAQQWNAPQSILNSLTVPTSDGFRVIPLPDLIYCQANSNYTNLVITGGLKIISSQTLGYYEDLLRDNKFFRTHRSYLISLDHVKSYKRGDGGYIIMSNGDEVELSRNVKSEFMQLFKG